MILFFVSYGFDCDHWSKILIMNMIMIMIIIMIINL